MHLSFSFLQTSDADPATAAAGAGAVVAVVKCQSVCCLYTVGRCPGAQADFCLAQHSCGIMQALRTS